MSSRGAGMYGRDQADPGWIAALLIGAVVAAFSLPGVLLGMVLVPVARRRRAAMLVAAVLGAGLTLLLWRGISNQMESALDAIRQAGGFWKDPEHALEVAWPHMRVWWLAGIGIAPVIAAAVEMFRPRSVEELRERDERRQGRLRARRERSARRAVGAPKPERKPAGFELGRHIDGDHLLPTRRGRVTMPLARLQRTLLVIGAPGSGKTETLLRLAHGVAGQTDWSVFMLDAKGDPHTQQRFASLMARGGRTPRLFPTEAYDGWRGDGREIANRLVQLIDWAEEGGGTSTDSATCGPATNARQKPSPASRPSTSTPAANATPPSSTPPKVNSTEGGHSKTPTAATCSSTSCSTARRPASWAASSSKTSSST
jgi:hypothetical protein